MRCSICGSKECCGGEMEVNLQHAEAQCKAMRDEVALLYVREKSFEELNDLVQDILASIPDHIINGYDFDKKLAKIVQKYENCS